MTFVDYIKSIPSKTRSPRRDMIRKVAAATFRDEMTIYSWLTGRTMPGPLERRAISELLKMPEAELFPSESKR